MKTGPFDIGQYRAILTPAMTAVIKAVTPSFYQELDEDFASFKGHILIQEHTFSEDWPTWEVHPAGDEIVVLLSGDTEFLVEIDGQRETLRVNHSNHYVVVPKGCWHTARPLETTSMLFITPGEGTLNAREPGGEPL